MPIIVRVTIYLFILSSILLICMGLYRFGYRLAGECPFLYGEGFLYLPSEVQEVVKVVGLSGG